MFAMGVSLASQVGVFSPSHRNHYLNVTPKNLVKIYLPGLSSGNEPQLCQELREEMGMVTPQVRQNLRRGLCSSLAEMSILREGGV